MPAPRLPPPRLLLLALHVLVMDAGAVAVPPGFGMVPPVSPTLFHAAPGATRTLLDSGILLASVAAVALNAFLNGSPPAPPPIDGTRPMPLLHHTYGKGRVRVMRVHRDGTRNEVRELTVQAMLEGGFAAAYTQADNRAVVATDTIKNIAYIVARENLQAPAEDYAAALARRFLERYPQVERAVVQTWETKWVRAAVDGAAHPHSFILDSNGRPTATATLSRTGPATITSGLAGYTFMKSTQSGWANFVSDECTTLPDTHDRLAATAMDAAWTWRAAPADYGDANARILEAMLREFATTYSHGIQDSLYRMGEAALAAVPEADTVSMACPNKHYIPVDLHRFGLPSDNAVFVPTDEPHGQIECTVGRG